MTFSPTSNGITGPLPVTSTQRMIQGEGFPPGLKVGESAPDFTLANQHGEDISFHENRDGSCAALVFFRSAVW